MPEVDAVTQGRRGITIATADGAATVGIVAVALSSAGLHPQSFTVRTPSLDDVFLLATGHRMPAADSAGPGCWRCGRIGPPAGARLCACDTAPEWSAVSAQTAVPAAPGGGMVRPVGIVTDIATVARRSVRSLLREPEAMAPALIIPTFFFVVNIGALESFVERTPGIDYRAFQIPVAIIFAVTGISRASVLVIDIQTGYLDRMLVTPVRRPRCCSA